MDIKLKSTFYVLPVDIFLHVDTVIMMEYVWSIKCHWDVFVLVMLSVGGSCVIKPV